MPLIAPAEAGIHSIDEALPVLWRDEHLIAIYKPAAWLVHRTGLDAGETRFIVQTLRDQIGQHVYPLHRLDKGTCGVLLLALHSEAASKTRALFEAQQIGKRYLALVRGWAPDTCAVDHALRPDDAAADAPAQPAQTRFARLASLEHPEAYDPRFAATRVSLVLAEPHTGRRHQIRRHLKHISHPIIGDATHGKGPLNRWWAERLGLQRLWLHAWQMRLQHPYTGEALQFDSGVPWPSPSTGLSEVANAACNHSSAAQWQQLLRADWQWSATAPNLAQPGIHRQ